MERTRAGTTECYHPLVQDVQGFSYRAAELHVHSAENTLGTDQNNQFC